MRCFTRNLAMALLAVGSWAADIDSRQNTCPSGSSSLTSSYQGQTYSVCCPGTAQPDGNFQACCIGGSEADIDFRAKLLKRDSSSSSTCIPITATDYSAQVASATASAGNGQGTGATTTGSAPATSSSKGAAMGMAPEPTVMPLLAGAVLAGALMGFP